MIGAIESHGLWFPESQHLLSEVSGGPRFQSLRRFGSVYDLQHQQPPSHHMFCWAAQGSILSINELRLDALPSERAVPPPSASRKFDLRTEIVGNVEFRETLDTKGKPRTLVIIAATVNGVLHRYEFHHPNAPDQLIRGKKRQAVILHEVQYSRHALSLNGSIKSISALSPVTVVVVPDQSSNVIVASIYGREPEVVSELAESSVMRRLLGAIVRNGPTYSVLAAKGIHPKLALLVCSDNILRLWKADTATPVALHSLTGRSPAQSQPDEINTAIIRLLQYNGDSVKQTFSLLLYTASNNSRQFYTLVLDVANEALTGSKPSSQKGAASAARFTVRAMIPSLNERLIDFALINDTLYAVWERTGQTLLQSYSLQKNGATWRVIWSKADWERLLSLADMRRPSPEPPESFYPRRLLSGNRLQISTIERVLQNAGSTSDGKASLLDRIIHTVHQQVAENLENALSQGEERNPVKEADACWQFFLQQCLGEEASEQGCLGISILGDSPILLYSRGISVIRDMELSESLSFLLSPELLSSDLAMNALSSASSPLSSKYFQSIEQAARLLSSTIGHRSHDALEKDMFHVLCACRAFMAGSAPGRLAEMLSWLELITFESDDGDAEPLSRLPSSFATILQANLFGPDTNVDEQKRHRIATVKVLQHLQEVKSLSSTLTVLFKVLDPSFSATITSSSLRSLSPSSDDEDEKEWGLYDAKHGVIVRDSKKPTPLTGVAIDGYRQISSARYQLAQLLFTFLVHVMDLGIVDEDLTLKSKILPSLLSLMKTYCVLNWVAHISPHSDAPKKEKFDMLPSPLKEVDEKQATSQEEPFLSTLFSQYLASISPASSSSPDLSGATPSGLRDTSLEEAIKFLQFICMYQINTMQPSLAGVDEEKIRTMISLLQEKNLSISLLEFLRLTGREELLEYQEIKAKALVQLQQHEKAHDCYIKAIVEGCWLLEDESHQKKAERITNLAMSAVSLFDGSESSAISLAICRAALSSLTSLQQAASGDLKSFEQQTQRLRALAYQKALTNRFYEQAYSMLMDMTDLSVRRESLARFVTQAVSEGDHTVILACPWIGLRADVEELLWAKAKSSDLQIRHLPKDEKGSSSRVAANYYDVLYAFLLSAHNYRRAAECMFHYALRLSAECDVSHGDREIGANLERQTHALLAVINTLQLLPEHHWIVFNEAKMDVEASSPYLESKDGGQSAKREDQESIKIVTIEHLRKRYALCTAHLELHRIQQSRSERRSRAAKGFESKYGLPPSPPASRLRGGMSSMVVAASETVDLLCRTGIFETAVSLALLFELDLGSVFLSLTDKCLQLQFSHQPDLIELSFEEDEDWDGCSSVVMPNHTDRRNKAWEMLCGLLRKHDTLATGLQHRLAVAEYILARDPRTTIPQWLVQLVCEGDVTARAAHRRKPSSFMEDESAEAAEPAKIKSDSYSSPGFAGNCTNGPALLRLMLRYHMLSDAVKLAIKWLQELSEEAGDSKSPKPELEDQSGLDTKYGSVEGKEFGFDFDGESGGSEFTFGQDDWSQVAQAQSNKFGVKADKKSNNQTKIDNRYEISDGRSDMVPTSLEEYKAEYGLVDNGNKRGIGWLPIDLFQDLISQLMFVSRIAKESKRRELAKELQHSLLHELQKYGIGTTK